jgi:hypothetical protein
METLFAKKVQWFAISAKIYKEMNKKGELTVITANSPSTLMSNGSKKTQQLIVN